MSAAVDPNSSLSSQKKKEEPARGSEEWAEKQSLSVLRHMGLNVMVLTIVFTQRMDVFMGLPKFRRDIAKVAVHLGTLTAYASTLEFLANPFLGKISDAVGRKPIMAVGPLSNLILKFLCYLAPNQLFLDLEKVVAGTLSVMSGTTMMNASFADVFAGDTNRQAQAQGKMGKYVGAGLIFGPIAGIALSKLGGPKAAYLGGAGVAGYQLWNLYQIDESLPLEKRKPFQFAGANPLSFLRLLRESRPLQTLAYMVGIMQNIPEGKNLADVHQSYSMTDVGMGEAARSFFVSFIGISQIAGAIASKKIYSSLGGQLFTSLTTCLMGLGMLWYSTVPVWLRSGWPMFVGAVIQCLSSSQGMFVRSVVSELAAEAKWGQGEFQGALANLRALTSAVLPILLAKIYAWSKSNGRNRPGLAYQVVAATSILTEIMFRSLSAKDLKLKNV